MLQHEHCDNCINLNRCNEQQLCSIIFCDQQCGVRFHGCKQEEHRLLCDQQIVSCLNRSFGCQMQMRRHEIRNHIARCPASVVHCSIEWNRWPLHSRSSRLAQPLLNAAALSSQNLDVALTLRDQRMLRELSQTDERIRCLLCNPLTRKYPALPISPYFGIRNDELNQQEKSQSMAIQSSPVLNTNANLSQTFTNEMLCIEKSNSIEPDVYDNSQKDYPHSSTSSAILSKSHHFLNEHISDDDSESSPWQMHKSPPGLRSSVCAKLNLDSTHDFCKVISDHIDDESTDNDDHEKPEEELIKVTSDQLAIDTQQSNLQITVQPIQNDLIHEIQCDSLDKFAPVATYRCISPTINLSNVDCSLILDLNFDSIAPFQPKPKQMFTFRCAQEFRRDEYQDHYHNVHSDIMGSLSGWMERRCPLWQYGCPAVFTRIRPFPYPSKIVYSALLESFGHLIICSDSLTNSSSASNLDHLTKDMSVCFGPKLNDNKPDSTLLIFPFLKLPTELIERVIEHLDNFSINNVSVTCKKLRNIASRLLNSRGLVSLVWKRVELDDESNQSKDFSDKSVQSHRWIVCRHRWFFSNSIHKIDRWRLFDDGQILNHMSKCPFNQPIRRKDPVFLRGLGSSFYNEVNSEEPQPKSDHIKLN